MDDNLRDSDEDLAFNIALGLMRTRLQPPKQSEPYDRMDALVSVGRRVVEHLKRSNWVFTRKRPEPMHGGAFPKPHQHQEEEGS